jgi:hypothetical protein
VGVYPFTEHIRQAHQASKGRYGAHASTPNCVDAAIGTPGRRVARLMRPRACAVGHRAGGSGPRSPIRRPPLGWI